MTVACSYTRGRRAVRQPRAERCDVVARRRRGGGGAPHAHGRRGRRRRRRELGARRWAQLARALADASRDRKLRRCTPARERRGGDAARRRTQAQSRTRRRRDLRDQRVAHAARRREPRSERSAWRRRRGAHDRAERRAERRDAAAVVERQLPRDVLRRYVRLLVDGSCGQLYVRGQRGGLRVRLLGVRLSFGHARTIQHTDGAAEHAAAVRRRLGLHAAGALPEHFVRARRRHGVQRHGIPEHGPRGLHADDEPARRRGHQVRAVRASPPPPPSLSSVSSSSPSSSSSSAASLSRPRLDRVSVRRRQTTRPAVVAGAAAALDPVAAGAAARETAPAPNRPTHALPCRVCSPAVVVSLARYYSQSSCTPARAALLTGVYPIRSGMFHSTVTSSSPLGVPLHFQVQQHSLTI